MRIKIFRQIVIALVLVHNCAETCLAAEGSGSTGKFRGWEYLAERLISDGVDRQAVAALYSSPQMPIREWVYFKLSPKESAGLYRGFTQPAKLKEARAFMQLHDKIFSKAEQQYKVSAKVICAIMLVESQLGKAMGRHLVANRLSRLAGIAEPANIEENMKNFAKISKPLPTKAEVNARARYLEEQFYPELRALFEAAPKQGSSVMTLKGSSAGAFGMPQFLPSSYLKFAVDGNKNGITSLLEVDDSIASIANYLASFGWTNTSTTAQRREILWQYNHSSAYIDTVLAVAKLL